MATVKTVGTGKDFTTLQLWEDFADDQAGADQHAECFSGVDLGIVSISGWTATPTASVFPRIFVSEGEGHDGKDEEVGARIECPLNGSKIIDIVDVDFMRIEGLRIHVPSGGSSDDLVGVNIDGEDALIDSILIHGVSSPTNLLDQGMKCVQMSNNADFNGPTIQNCIFYPGIWDTASTGGIVQIRYARTSEGTSDMDARLYNNTVLGKEKHGIYYSDVSKNGTPRLTITLTNNIVMDHGTEDYTDDTGFGGPPFSVTRAKNLSSDTSGDTGLQSKASSDQFVDNNTDFHLKAGADALDGGDVVGAFDWDAEHQDGDNWRPQGSATDIGGLEFEVEGDTVENSIMMVQ